MKENARQAIFGANTDLRMSGEERVDREDDRQGCLRIRSERIRAGYALGEFMQRGQPPLGKCGNLDPDG